MSATAHLTPRGIAQAAMLVREGGSPLSPATSETALRHRVAEIAEALG